MIRFTLAKSIVWWPLKMDRLSLVVLKMTIDWFNYKMNNKKSTLNTEMA